MVWLPYSHARFLVLSVPHTLPILSLVLMLPSRWRGNPDHKDKIAQYDDDDGSPFSKGCWCGNRRGTDQGQVGSRRGKCLSERIEVLKDYRME